MKSIIDFLANNIMEIMALIISVLSLFFTIWSRIKTESNRKEDLDIASKNRKEDLEKAEARFYEDSKLITVFLDNKNEIPPEYFNPVFFNQLVKRLEKYNNIKLLFSQKKDNITIVYLNLGIMPQLYCEYVNDMKNEMENLKQRVESKDRRFEIELLESELHKSMKNYCEFGKNANIEYPYRYDEGNRRGLIDKYGFVNVPAISKESHDNIGYTEFFIFSNNEKQLEINNWLCTHFSKLLNILVEQNS